MATDASKNLSVGQENSAPIFTFSNGSCTPEMLDTLSPEYVDAEALIKKRLLLRIPMWIFSACALYMSVMLLVNSRKKTRKKKKEQYSAKLKVGRLIATCFTALNLTYFSVSIFIERTGKTYCDFIYRADNFLYWVNISGIYTVLWLRQRVIYRQRSLIEAVSKVTSFLSYATVVMVVALPLMNSILFFSGMKYCFDEYVQICLLAVQPPAAYYTALVVTEIAVPVLVPVTLLGLFAWPLIQYHRSSDKEAKGQRPVIRVLYRIVVATLICLLSDIGAMVCNDQCEVFVSPTFRHFALFCNIACLDASFTDWRCVLLPMLGQPTLARAESSHPMPKIDESAV